jgi:cytochrome c peroxidase
MRVLKNPSRLVAVAVFATLSACKPALRDPNWKPSPSRKMIAWFEGLQYQGHKGTTPYKLEFPDWFIHRSAPRITLTREAVELGRFLFYDKTISSDSTVACASCHQQKHNFTDPRRFSVGVKGRQGTRNSMQLINLVLDDRFFWDGRAGSLEEQIPSPIEGDKEMDMPFHELAWRLQQHPVYPSLFERAYGKKEISKDKIIDAIAQFVRSIISYSMPEEYFRAVQDGRLQFRDLPPDIAPMWPLFFETTIRSNCGPCHQNAYQTGQKQFENVMPDNKTDPGYYVATKNEADRGKFKVVVLRSLPLTGPYMHDGSVTSMREALTHYRSGRFTGGGSQAGAYRDEYGNLKTDALSKAQLDLYEKAFSLNIDKKVISDPQYSDPF